jgi:hypothetical protein
MNYNKQIKYNKDEDDWFNDGSTFGSDGSKH